MEMQLPSYLLIYLIFIWAFSNVKLLCPFLIWPFTNSFLRGRSTNLHGYRYHSPWFRKWKQRERWKRGRAGGALWEEEEGGTLGLRTPRWGPMGELVIRRGHGEMWNRHRVWCIYWGIEAISGASGSHSRETEQPCSTKRATKGLVSHVFTLFQSSVPPYHSNQHVPGLLEDVHNRPSHSPHIVLPLPAPAPHFTLCIYLYFYSPNSKPER